MAKLWGGRFSKNTNELVDAFNASINYDKRLYQEDIRGSIAHANMLVKCGIIPEADGKKIAAGLQDILKDIEAGNFEFSVAHGSGMRGQDCIRPGAATTRWRWICICI